MPKQSPNKSKIGGLFDRFLSSFTVFDAEISRFSNIPDTFWPDGTTLERIVSASSVCDASPRYPRLLTCL